MYVLYSNTQLLCINLYGNFKSFNHWYEQSINNRGFYFCSYVQAGAMAIKLILRNFAPVIKSNMAAPPVSVGVDLVREER